MPSSFSVHNHINQSLTPSSCFYTSASRSQRDLKKMINNVPFKTIIFVFKHTYILSIQTICIDIQDHILNHGLDNDIDGRKIYSIILAMHWFLITGIFICMSSY